jgi:translation initiation factor 2 beta subunit (eIF-2beta)/eIF-5
MELQVSNCCNAPANPIMKGDKVYYTCSKCGNECGVKKLNKTYTHVKGKKQ